MGKAECVHLVLVPLIRSLESISKEKFRHPMPMPITWETMSCSGRQTSSSLTVNGFIFPPRWSSPSLYMWPSASLRPCPYQFNQVAWSLSSACPNIPFSIVPHMAFHSLALLVVSDVLTTCLLFFLFLLFFLYMNIITIFLYIIKSSKIYSAYFDKSACS